MKAEKASWRFEEGAALCDGRTVLEPLGGGSRYEVFLVWDEHLSALMVAKVLRPDQAESERALRDLEREADLLEQLAHPVIVRGFDAVLDGPHPHLLIEHLEGPTLRALIRREGPLPLEHVLPLALQVAAAIHYLAGEEVVHLDVKPDNIVMGVPPRLIDLSVARSFARAARLSGPVGTDAYMAPEQCDAETYAGQVGPAADVWGLAATLFHALAGRAPFPREKGARRSDDPRVRFPQLHEPPLPFPEQVPAELQDLLLACLDRDPGARPDAAGVTAVLRSLHEPA